MTVRYVFSREGSIFADAVRGHFLAFVSGTCSGQVTPLVFPHFIFHT